MTWNVLARVGLPVHEDREVWPGVTVPVPTGESTYKDEGDTITAEEFEEHGQTPDDIDALVESGAIEEAE
jgi:hypothetical protein